MYKRRKFIKEDELTVHFPDRELDLGGTTVIMTPLKVKHSDHFLEKFAQIRKLAGMDIAESVKLAALAQLVIPTLPYCISGMKAEDISVEFLPDVLKVWLEQNFNDELQKKWGALAVQANERFDWVNDFIGQSLSPAHSTA